MGSRRKKRVIIEVCPECKVREGDSSRKRLYNCYYCGRYFCKRHLPPRLAVMRNAVEEIKDPALKDKVYEEWRKPNGHPDWNWTRKYFEKLEKEEEEKREKIFGVLEEMKEKGKPGYIPEIPITTKKKVKISIKLPHWNFKRVIRKMSFWYVVYFSIIGILSYLTKNSTSYFFLINYLKYPLYIFSLLLGLYVPYRLFKKFESKEPTSDLQLWWWKILSGLIAGASTIILFFGVTFFFSAIISDVGKELGYALSIFFGSLFLGLILFSAYLLFKYKVRSGIIIHRGEW